MIARVFAIVTCLVIASVASAAYLPGGMTLGRASTSTVSGSTTTSSSSSVCTTRSVSTQAAEVLNGTFTYSPSLPVKVESVQATVYANSAGVRTIVFSVTFVNDGTSPIFIEGGCGGSLSSAVASGSGVVERVNSTVFCFCPAFIRSMAPGTGAIATGPGCWSGYSYRVIGSGPVEAYLVLRWSGNSTSPQETDIAALFNV